ncbi:glycosyltransferase family 90 protein [Serpula lacrymans var. lacrymans S7.3]|uniref:Glycosyltransferase family 90 protein n=2 Tax=Serpula lacrymans var. lacrymans TaxID=341189 RepID=F8PSR0_SERL3|nr:glycosyltransferase family 90 protein [Serpula lacrymans var. lacrymans S7.3]
MAEAEEKFRNLLSRQSKSLEHAVAEYKRRYNRNPPKGFDDWWAFAKQHNVKLVDEYDGLVEDLAPFWNLTGQELRRRALQVGRLPSIDLVRIQDGVAINANVEKIWVDTERGHRSLGFRTMMEKFQEKLPDMYFPVNAKAEGRVLVPWEHQNYPNLTEQDSTSEFEVMLREFSPDWSGRGNVWEAWRRTCPADSPARRLFSSRRGPTNENIKVFLGPVAEARDEVTFVEQPDTNLDFCEYPWAHYNQGHFFSDWRTIPILYPVFSPARAQGFSDIRIPSHYYHGQNQYYTYGWDPLNVEPKLVDDMEVPWDDKEDAIFWRGATTGGGNSPPGFAAQYQRHRFLQMSDVRMDANRTIAFADPPSSTNFVSARVSSKQLNDEIMDTAFVSSTGNYPEGEEALREHHRFADSVPLGKHWSYKYLIDLDGMSYSARFMAFLASDSAVIKSTVYREYFTDWIQPWLHYIPLSSSYQEIYNIHAFFSGATQSTLEAANSTSLQLALHERRSEDGDMRLRRIARAGKQWKQTIGRTIDMEAYVYRLCLEYARLWADDRDSMSFTL